MKENHNSSGTWTEKFAYDAHGNLLKKDLIASENSLQATKKGFTLLYKGNRMLSINPLETYAYNAMGTEKENVLLEDEIYFYRYDADGNIIQDAYKGIKEAKYSFSGLPERVVFKNNNEIRYTYDASGRKIKVQYLSALGSGFFPIADQEADKLTLVALQSESEVFYCGEWILGKDKKGRLRLIRELFDGGFQQGGRNYYFVRNHLGSNVALASFNDAGEMTVEQRNSYSAFGLQMLSESDSVSVKIAIQPYKYCGKEFERMNGFDAYDFGARFYDPEIGRFLSPDPLSEANYSVSPYAYCSNNPVSRTDPTGMSDDWYQSSEGDLIWKNSEKQQLNIGGRIFRNIGDHVSFRTGDGGYWNFLQNYGYKSSQAENAWGRAIRDAKMNEYLLHSATPFPERTKVKLMQALIRKGQQDFLNDPRTQAAVFVLSSLIQPEVALANAAKVAPQAAGQRVQFTKSNLKLGQQMHKSYKKGADGIKEFRLPSGKRIDFLDVKNGVIYELKPFNPRAMKAGQRQLNMYLKEIQSPVTLHKHTEFKGINWKTVLDTY